MPAEWERHAATWLAWPHNRTDWPGKFTVIPWVYGEIARRLAPGEPLRILVNSAAHERGARRVLSRVGAPLERIEFLRWPTDRSWTRDYGPIFARREGPRPEVAVARFRFTAWAKYPNWKRDDRIAERAAQHFKRQLFTIAIRGRGVVLEGGSIDVNGRGTLLTTEECLLDPEIQTRNPGMTRAEYETVLRDALGAGNILWLGQGIAGDDTHGHVDDLCRFVNPTTVVACTEHRFSDENYRALSENRERLAGMQTEDGTKLEVVELPMPEPLIFEGRRLPASYANFYIGNAAVLVPTFNDPADRQALGILSELFDRPVVGIHAVDLVWGLGTLHCLTQQEPEPGVD